MTRKAALVLSLTVVILGATQINKAEADHPWPNILYGYLATYYELYPERSGHLTWKAWTIQAEPVPLAEAWLLVDVVDNTWEQMFNYALAVGGYRLFDFEGIAYDQSADVSYARMDTQQQVDWFCSAGAAACLHWDPMPAGEGVDWVDDADRDDRRELIRADIVYGPAVWGDPNDEFRHGTAHEWGHGFGLAHHGVGVCETVMSGDGCTNMPAASDIATALDTVYGY